jgi:hypothetical protein
MLLTLFCLTQACFQMIVERGKSSQEQNFLTNFKIHFAAEHLKFHLKNQTTQQSGFYSDKIMVEDHHYQGTADAIAQLEVTTASDHDTAATLTDTNVKLTLQLETLQAYVQKLHEDIVNLKLKIKPAWQGQRP